MYSGKIVLIVPKWLCSGNSYCVRAIVVLFKQKRLYSGKNWLYSGKVVVFGQMWLYSGKLVLFGQKRLYSAKSLF